MGNSKVYFDVTWAPSCRTASLPPPSRASPNLCNDIIPKTSENFRALCTVEKGFGYTGSTFTVKNSQFFGITVITSWLNIRYVVFGKVANQNSLNIIKALKATGFGSGAVNSKE
ncbi:hypothetical protein BGZ61DRAFT_473726 [Ilyonectria robusta]|uniref:uncharacterized protein n=1 Tax=Ilyonectria robusta TaxID=1079257 RepID=UPI001E8E425B|nr:uncharacterized protein BGZ61DRAFT_473726 [Ilyonectria robusta]KAH8735085.1 hypothetical protein BGZ61DRAFT_473726 [Ilyonectria robusta]